MLTYSHSAGFFICIAWADLLPEVALHDHDRGKLTAALLLGVSLAFAIENLPGHDHANHPDHSHSTLPAIRRSQPEWSTGSTLLYQQRLRALAG